VQVFDSNGSFLKLFDVGGPFHPTGISISRAGFLFVSDYRNHCTHVFDSEGVFIRRFGAPGSADGQLSGPFGLNIDVDGNCVVADRPWKPSNSDI